MMSSARPINEAVSVIRSQKLTLKELYNFLTNDHTNFEFDLHETNSLGDVTILHAASASGNAELVDALLKMGMKPNQVAKSGETALMLAMKAGSLACVQLLILHGARLDYVCDDQGTTCIDFAKKSSKVNHKIQAYILSLPVSDHFNPESRKANFDAHCEFVKAIEAGDLVQAKSIYSRHIIDVNRTGMPDSGVSRCIESVVRQGNMEAVKFLVECGSYVVGGHSGERPLPAMAREAGHEGVAVYLESVQKNRYEILRTLAHGLIEELIINIEVQIKKFEDNSQSLLGIGNKSKAEDLQAALLSAKGNQQACLSIDAFLNHKDGNNKSINEVLGRKRIGFFTPALSVTANIITCVITTRGIELAVAMQQSTDITTRQINKNNHALKSLLLTLKPSKSAFFNHTKERETWPS